VGLLADSAASADVEILNFSKPPEALPATAQLPMEAAGLKPQAPPPALIAPTPAPPAKSKPVAAAKPQTPAADAAPAEDMDR